VSTAITAASVSHGAFFRRVGVCSMRMASVCGITPGIAFHPAATRFDRHEGGKRGEGF
jgi:hypothetical protein